MPKMADLLKDGLITDPFFHVLQDSDWNACIGKQSDELNYVEGYLQAAQLLVDTLMAQQLFGQRDTLVLPILYNARHGLELTLKFVLGELVTLDLARRREGGHSHDLLVYWTHLHDQSIGDYKTRTLIADLKPYVDSLAKIDDDGQELRYFTNRDGQQSLGEQAVANLRLIQAGIKALSDISDQLIDRLYSLTRESVTGVRTDRCSRSDLAEIAQSVGSRASWSEDAFDARKAAVCEKFGLSNAAFSNALNAIQNSRELRVLIELETPLLYITPDLVMDVAGRWLEANPPRSFLPRVVDATDIHIDEFLDDKDGSQARTAALDRWALGALSIEQFADLQTIFYVGRNREFGEEYEGRVEGTVRTHQRDQRRIAIVHHILSKTNFIDGLVVGLKRVGQPTLAAAIEALQNKAHSPP